MTLLHDYFNTRNLQAFQRLLDGSSSNDRGSSSSAIAPSSPGSSYTAGKSFNRNGGVTHGGNNNIDVNVNARDWLGRTVLHLVCATPESISVEYARALLKHPNIDVNLPDTESMWTPLHRVLYAANLPVALLLLQRSDIDAAVKDAEGYTAIDLYNSTVNGTKPDPSQINAELYTWGTNKNAALGLSDADDRVHPDHVVIKPKEEPPTHSSLAARFDPIPVRQVHMSKLHTVVVTGESEGNLRVCGFGSGGRLGTSQHMQYALKPLPAFSLQIASVAVGQDHTLALTTSGDVYSWGLNRFSQLGYIVELSSTAAAARHHHEEVIQSTPKRVVGVLRREVVCGVAASKNASACWTKEGVVFTWGTNTGQLGYDRHAQPVQVLPRPVTKFSNAVIDIAMSDTVLVALLVTHHVECIWNDRHYRISFPTHAFPSGIEPYRPPHSLRDSWISKVTCCDDAFAALSSNGEVFTFAAPGVGVGGDSSASAGGGGTGTFRPQRVWALRRKFSAVKDVALGADGSIIICTESGHVFVRTRNIAATTASSSSSTGGGGGKAFKFTRVPFLQRVTKVCANASGAFGALRVDYRPKQIEVVGSGIGEDLRGVQPFLRRSEEGEGSTDGSGMASMPQEVKASATTMMAAADADEPEDSNSGIESDIAHVLELCDVLQRQQQRRKASGSNSAGKGKNIDLDLDLDFVFDFKAKKLPHGADALIHVQSFVFPVHSVLLAARSSVLQGLMEAGGVVGEHDHQAKFGISIELLPSVPGPGPRSGIAKITRLAFKGCHHPLTVLVLLHYIYSDELLAVWDRRIGGAVQVQHAFCNLLKGNVNPGRVRQELQLLARVLDLSALSAALEAPVKREPVGTMVRDMGRLFDTVQDASASSSSSFSSPLTTSSLRPDVILQLADREVRCHSVVLRARSPLFASFFDLEDWTRNRWDEGNMVRVDMRHMRWDVVRFVVRFMCCGEDEEMFYVLDFVSSVEELVQFMFQVLAAANELLLDRLVLLCSSVILAHTNISNACYILADASHYHVQPLIAKLHEYISINMESFLVENRILDELPHALVKELALFVRERQVDKSPFARSGEFVKRLVGKYGEWLSGEDVPDVSVFVRTSVMRPLRRDFSSARISPPIPAKVVPGAGALSRNWTVLSKSSTAAAASLSKTAAEFTPHQTLRRPPSGDDIFAMDDHSDATASASTLESGNKCAMPMPAPAVKSPPVWKAAGVPRVDMKTVMAEAASQSQPSPSRHPFVQGLSSSSRPAVTRTPQTAGGGAGPSNDPSGSLTPSKQALRQPSGSGSPMTWRVNVDPNTARGLSMGPSTPPTSSAFASGSPKDVPNARPVAGPSSSSKVQGAAAPTTPGRGTQPPGLGPVITPTRQTSSSKTSLSSHRNAIGSKAWSQSQPFGPQPAPSPTAPTKGVSLVAIQHSQQEQVTPVKDKRSLREIQAEERELQAEADFMKWWTAEEQRVQAEQEMEALALAQFQSNLNSSNANNNKKHRKPKPRGPLKPQSGPAAAASTSGKPEAGSSSAAPQNADAPPAHTPRRRPHKPRQKSHADP